MPAARSADRADAGALADAPLRASYYVYGPVKAEAVADHLLARVRARLVELASPPLQVVRLEGAMAWQAAAFEARTFGLGGRRLIVARPEGSPGPAVAEALTRALDQPAPGVCLWVREPAEGGRADRVVAALRKGAWAAEAAAPDRRGAPGFLDRAARAWGVTLAPGTAVFLFGRVGEDLSLALGELAKYRDVWPDGSAVDRAAVERLTPDTSAARVFAVGDAYLQGDLAAALRAARAALQGGESPFALTAHLERQVRLLQAARGLVDEARAAGRRLAGDQAAAALGLAAWQVRGAVAAAERGRPDPAGAVAELLACELDMRSGVPPALAVDRVLVRLLAAS